MIAPDWRLTQPDFIRDRFSLWRPILDGKELLDISRCHQKEVCETIGRYIRGWMRRELECLDAAFFVTPQADYLDAVESGLSDGSIGPFPQEAAFNSSEAISQAAEQPGQKGEDDDFGDRLFAMNGCQCSACRKRREWFGPQEGA